MNLTAAGIGSGLDLESIIEAFVTAEAVPSEVRLQNKEDRITTELSGVGAFKSALSTFQSVLDKMADTDDFNKQIIDVSSSDISVETNGYASNGVFSVEVQQLALATRMESTNFTSSADTVGDGTLNFTAGSDTFDVVINATDTLSAIRDKINEADDNFGLTANIITTDAGTFLSYSSEITGEDNELTVTTAEAALDGIATNATISQNATNAIININGNAVTNSTNEFKNSIEDVTITAKAENVGEITTIAISQDEDNGKKLLDNFVAAYNALRSTMDVLGNAETGDLAFDPNIRQMKSQLTSVVTDSINSLSGNLDSLSDVGITLDRNGKLEVSAVAIGTLSTGSATLADVLENNLNEIGELFASDDGIASQLSTLIDDYNGSDGTLTVWKTALNLEKSSIADEYEALESRLRDYEDTLRKKFGFLDATVSSFNATSAWLESTLSSLPGNNKD